MKQLSSIELKKITGGNEQKNNDEIALGILHLSQAYFSAAGFFIGQDIGYGIHDSMVARLLGGMVGSSIAYNIGTLIGVSAAFAIINNMNNLSPQIQNSLQELQP